MKLAVGQFQVSRDWQDNASTIITLMQQANAQAARLLVLPEAVLARDNQDSHWVINAAQPIDGPFLGQLLIASQTLAVTTIFTMHVPAEGGKARNVLIALRQGEILLTYDKIHLYDAFTVRESDNVVAGETLPPLLHIDDFTVGVMTCYDLRFPEMARALARQGAELLVLPAAWLKGPNKELHWELLTRARALENTCYMVASGECGPKNIGHSLVVDPLGLVIAQAGERPQLVFTEIDKAHLSVVREQLPVLQHCRLL
ncbi:deaminated glutathione amidase [Rosenbergiella australiborealis]|uniref:deaminated glutathione amidase n=1 Tax=Rosenbergiella australiborealis TaxID=1544696 RepID=UPI001F4D6DFB|nr:deaminated glutathione amidase [Rosenbergiella australiborealis]